MTPSLNDIAGSEHLRRFERKEPVPRGLPAFAYTSGDYWALEKERLFGNAWVFVGFAHELAAPGDAVPVTVGGKPLFVLRDRDDKIRAFHNACRHRCLKLIDEATNVGPRIRCPYHSWVYRLNGELQSTPFFGGPDEHNPCGFDKARHGLLPIPCEVWHDWIFVNLNPEPSDFEQHVVPLKNRLSGISLDRLLPVATLDFGKVRTNWKHLMENFIEPYHVQFVHVTTTDQPLKDHRTITDNHCLGSAVEISKSSKKGKNTLAVNSLYLTLFPNFVFGHYVPDQVGVHLNLPVDVDRTRQKRVIYVTDGRARSDREIEALRDLWINVHKEDHAMCERLQAGKASDAAAEGGVLSPHWENSVRRFQELVFQAVR